MTDKMPVLEVCTIAICSPISPDWDIPLRGLIVLRQLFDYILPDPFVPDICSSAKKSKIFIK